MRVRVRGPAMGGVWCACDGRRSLRRKALHQVMQACVVMIYFMKAGLVSFSLAFFYVQTCSRAVCSPPACNLSVHLLSNPGAACAHWLCRYSRPR